MNSDWYLNFPEARVTHLTRCHSDHCPVLLETMPHNRVQLDRPFKFQRYWLSDLSFPQIVVQAWGQPTCLHEAIKKFAVNASDWNRNHFGNIFAKKNRIRARLNGIQRVIATRPSSYLLELEKMLIQELEVILNQEHELWALKSRVNWMVQGDRNTAFYHVSALVRRNRNRITAIKNSVGEWINSEVEVMEFIRRGFCDIYASSHTSSNWQISQFHAGQVSLNDEERDSLWDLVTDEEIKAGLWSMKANKAPGPDGLHAGFFQLFWPTVGDSVIREVKQIFASRTMPEYLNQTHIVLIPKNSRA